MATAASGCLSLACLHSATSARGHALGCMVVSSLKIMHFSLFQTAPGEPSVIEQAPGDGRPSQRPLLRADIFALNTNRCGFKTRSNGQEEHAGLALLDGDGPASPARCQDRPASASVQTRNRTKRRTAQSNQAHNTPGRPGNKDSGENRESRAPQKSFRAFWRRGRRTAYRRRAKKRKETKKETAKETVFEMRRGRKQRKDPFGVALP